MSHRRFEPLGGRDDFPTSLLEREMLKIGVIKPHVKGDDSSDDEVEEDDPRKRKILGSYHKTESDEDSDFD